MIWTSKRKTNKNKNNRQMWRVLSALVLTTIVCLSCHRQKNVTGLIIGTEKAVISLDPRKAVDSYSVRAIRLIYSGLFKTSATLEPVPDLLETYEVSSDGKNYTFTLKNNVICHDGQNLTTDDVVAYLNYVRDKKNASPYRASLGKIDTIKKKNDREFSVTLVEPYASFRTGLTLGIVPKKYIGEFQPIGCGPYFVKQDNKKQGLELARFDKYFASLPKIPSITLKPILEDSIRILELLKGTVHLLQNSVPANLLGRLKESDEVKIAPSPGLAYAYMGFNLNDEILGNVKVRRAFAHAVNREEIIKHKLKSFGTKATTLLAPSHYLHSDKVVNYSFDLEKAKRLLDEAGYKDPDGDTGPQVRFTVEYKSSTNPERVEIAQVIQDQLKKVGIGVKLKTLEFGTFFDDIKKGQFQIYTLEWSQITDEDIYHYVFHSESLPPNGANRGFYKNEKIDRLTEAGRRTMNKTEREKIYHEIQEILAADIPYVSLWYRNNITAYRKPLSNYQTNTVADYQALLNADWHG